MRCSGPALVNRGAIDIRWMALAEEYADSKAGHKTSMSVRSIVQKECDAAQPSSDQSRNQAMLRR